MFNDAIPKGTRVATEVINERRLKSTPVMKNNIRRVFFFFFFVHKL